MVLDFFNRRKTNECGPLVVKEDGKVPFSGYDYITVSQHFIPVVYSTGINKEAVVAT